jgi:transcriptional regulator with XRE-family HTH domain
MNGTDKKIKRSHLPIRYPRTPYLLRTQLGLSQGKLAKELGISQMYVSLIEGGYAPSPKMQALYANFFGMDAKEIFAEYKEVSRESV